jgi:hypothetical protein
LLILLRYFFRGKIVRICNTFITSLKIETRIGKIHQPHVSLQNSLLVQIPGFYQFQVDLNSFPALNVLGCSHLIVVNHAISCIQYSYSIFNYFLSPISCSLYSGGEKQDVVFYSKRIHYLNGYGSKQPFFRISWKVILFFKKCFTKKFFLAEFHIDEIHHVMEKHYSTNEIKTWNFCVGFKKCIHVDLLCTVTSV